MSKNKEWSLFVKTIRKELGLKRPEFASLLAITLITLDSWEYLGVIPAPIYQCLINELYKRNSEFKAKLKKDKWKYLNACQTKKGQNNRNDKTFWKEAKEENLTIGAILLITETTTEYIESVIK